MFPTKGRTLPQPATVLEHRKMIPIDNILGESVSSITSYPQHWTRRNEEYDQPLGEDVMEFRLIYEGILLTASRSDTRATHKHAIRKKLHKQLAELWQVHPLLQKMSTQRIPPDGLTYQEKLARRFERCGFHFVPLVSEEVEATCSLDILILRREPAGNVRFDIDNRLKTLFDALRIPKDCDEVKAQPDDSEKPFFCLLEDDSHITSISVTTDRLLTPVEIGRSEKEVFLVINVKINEASSSQIGGLSFTNVIPVPKLKDEDAS